MLLVNKITLKATPVKNILNDMDGLYSYSSISGSSTSPGVYIVSLEPHLVNLRLDQMEDISPHLQNIKSIKLENEDNPVLFIYKMKQVIDNLD